MTVEFREADGQRIYTVKQGAETLGFIAVDSTVAGRSRGGLRLVEDVSEAEIRAAARAMTFKYGLLGLPQGGAKAGVRGAGEATQEHRRHRLLEFARAAEPLLADRVYVPDADMGTSARDVRWMMRTIGCPVRRRDWRGTRSGYYTAVSCVTSAAAAAGHLGIPLAGCRVAIEGFGSVGGALGALMRDRGAKVVAVSTSQGALYDSSGLDVDRISALAAESGSRAVRLYDDAEQLERAALLELPVDVLCPCARFHSVDAHNASRVSARVICAGANDPLSSDAERILFERGTMYLPDFVTNCGGVLGGTMEFASVKPERIAATIDDHIGRLASRLLDRAERQGVTPRSLVEPVAMERFERIRVAAAQPTLRARLFALGLESHRRGWAPSFLVAAMAPRYVRDALRGWDDL